AFFGLTNDERTNGPLAAPQQNAPAGNSLAAEAAPREPLAELGVAPGYSTDSASGNATAAPAEPPPAVAPEPPPSPPAR
ncbi:MAG: hypothetical protein ABW173_10660, partial [Sphingomonas sp.]